MCATQTSDNPELWDNFLALLWVNATVGLLPVTKPRTSDHWRLGRLLMLNTAHTIAIASDFSLIAQQFTIAAFATIGCHCFPHEEIRDWTTHTVWQAVHRGDCCIRSQRKPLLVIQWFTLTSASQLFCWFWADSNQITAQRLYNKDIAPARDS